MWTLLSLWGAVASASVALVNSSSLRRPAPTACRAADSITAREIFSLVQATRTDSIWLSRVHLPFAPDTAIVVVSDPTICAKALAAHNRVAGYTAAELAEPASASVYVLRVGTVYVTFNTSFRSGEFVNHFVWTSTFTLLDNFL